jgi:hypothetical protein
LYLLSALQGFFGPNGNVIQQFVASIRGVNACDYYHVNAMTEGRISGTDKTIYIPLYVSKGQMIFRTIILHHFVQIIAAMPGQLYVSLVIVPTTGGYHS